MFWPKDCSSNKICPAHQITCSNQRHSTCNCVSVPKNLPHTLAAGAADKVAAAILLDGLKAFGTALGVSKDPLDVLSLRTLGVPFLPYGARAR